MTKVIVLNNDFSIIGTTTYKRAVRLIVTGKAEPLANSEIRIHPSMLLPLVIRLVKAIRNLWKKAVPWSKNSISVRDGYTCQYCGAEISRKKVTVDHVIPKSQGGKNSWENTVCCCFSCNNKKDNKTPTQAGMSLLRKPYQPTIMEFLMQKIEADGLDKILRSIGVY